MSNFHFNINFHVFSLIVLILYYYDRYENKLLRYQNRILAKNK